MVNVLYEVVLCLTFWLKVHQKLKITIHLDSVKGLQQVTNLQLDSTLYTDFSL